MQKDLKSLNDFYITSDTWFGRPQILQIANRKFNDSCKKYNLVCITDPIESDCDFYGGAHNFFKLFYCGHRLPTIVFRIVYLCYKRYVRYRISPP